MPLQTVDALTSSQSESDDEPISDTLDMMGSETDQKIEEVDGEVQSHSGQDTEDACSVSISTAKAMLMRVVLWLKLHSQLVSTTKTATIDIRDIPFLQRNTDNLFMLAIGTSIQPTEVDAHQQRLDNTLASWNLKRVSTPGDGDCFFHSIVFGLQQLAGKGNSHAASILQAVNLQAHSPSQRAQYLRKLVVTEWTGPNSDQYQSFLGPTQIADEALRFLQPGVHGGELGDLVVIAMTNALCIPIMVFTSATNFPVATILPTYNVAATAEPIKVALTQCGSGHFDAVQMMTTETAVTKTLDSTAGENETVCTCGRNKGKGAACATTTFGYLTRCP